MYGSMGLNCRTQSAILTLSSSSDFSQKHWDLSAMPFDTQSMKLYYKDLKIPTVKEEISKFNNVHWSTHAYTNFLVPVS